MVEELELELELEMKPRRLLAIGGSSFGALLACTAATSYCVGL